MTRRRARIGERAARDGDELPFVGPDAERELQDPVVQPDESAGNLSMRGLAAVYFAAASLAAMISL